MTKTVEELDDRLFYVYKGTLGEEVVYIGMGSKDRSNHLNSGTSHVYEANQAHFRGLIIDIDIVFSSSIREEAREKESELIRGLEPKWNLALSGKQPLRKKLSSVLDRDLISEPQKVFVRLAARFIESDYSMTITSKDFSQIGGGGKIAAYLQNYRVRKTEHPVLGGFERIQDGVYKLTFREKYITQLCGSV